MSQSKITRKVVAGRRTKAAQKIIDESKNEEENVRESQRQRKRKVRLVEEDVEVPVPKKTRVTKVKKPSTAPDIFEDGMIPVKEVVSVIGEPLHSSTQLFQHAQPLNFESVEDEENSNDNSNTISSSPDGLDEHDQQSHESDSSNSDDNIPQSKGKKLISASFLFNKKESVSHQATVSKRVTDAAVVDVDENRDDNDSTRPGTSKQFSRPTTSSVEPPLSTLLLRPETLTRKVIGMDSKLDYIIKGMTELLNQRRSNNETTVNDDTVCNSSTSFITNSLKTRFPLNSVAEVVEVELALKSNAEFVNKLMPLDVGFPWKVTLLSTREQLKYSQKQGTSSRVPKRRMQYEILPSLIALL
ncbi:hypothetical protein DAPPUDRAFT_115623 [Daphnia pulex]|uniref:Uncharacterized protein n=1 Tax=Daphnia pulex TaxID=6669 RepID=E9HM10_DAPPU|nr:hypothetical protein DAPPUDRAFT_115623 [Daphnia pulex]|eukprot:EFX67229.1 hypothetical protein DAPPUDRAFT_115623 [Daphnia pulex]